MKCQLLTQPNLTDGQQDQPHGQLARVPELKEEQAALAELKANDTEEDKAAYAKLLAETQPVLEILDDVLGED